MNKIMFTGGGSAGHVTVNLALIPHFVEAGWSVDYIGSENGIEKQLVSSLSNVNYFGISTGKLRRYFDWQNVKDPFKVVKGVFQAYRHIKVLKPNVLFSKGGFVSVPVVLGAWLNKVPVIIHESDITPGLANRISIPFAAKICTTFPETAKHLQTGKTEYVGAVIREELKHGNADKGRAFCRFTENKPVLLIMGGSLGSRRINETVRRALDKLTETFQVVHLCGKGQLDSSIQNDNYRQYEFINEQLPDILEMSDVIISRAGSNSIFEFLYLRKPMLLIPLTKEQSRGDQILNARSFEALGFCEVLYEENLTEETLLNQAAQLYEHRLTYVRKMTDYEQRDALNAVIQLIEQAAKAN
ncbi:undecaprenyldiphospho-muramoylpentapeptide beta-N-acetylglucosaminyltransferase [Paenibacillus abyssi]|uniref:UDP-N-acetylglucosamine--N-acetylmuramyl-(pentapeptide) pyrophosphoryl-undecaprenol N-acetylglucosamine transferase n=1 Tax=Paenibacillus abyssi TaxID=1340531 RepID=A0A917FLP6_9BACL|nr:undecaprenyldiphospho-muramoylpentapeptide beta-N-acetylglucosaminyltransferase [Paenibacillus abyssi]GGF90195.1 UDP-N-acetylglucosamine--N-acetylmuramyl-(pentapeptide) pyrophosphoryl-undecaprenol N-acetylglucosamine transferase 2 [Paenibacillus abyssi]